MMSLFEIVALTCLCIMIILTSLVKILVAFPIRFVEVVF